MTSVDKRCTICKIRPVYKKLTNARHLTGENACRECYEAHQESESQGYLFDGTVEGMEEDQSAAMDYDTFLKKINQLGYKLPSFCLEIGVNKNTPSTTWKKKGEIPFLVKEYINSKLNKVEKPKTVYLESAAIEEVERLKKEIEEIQKKELYIISYCHKKGYPGGGGYRVRATNREEAIELGKEHYSDIGNDKKYIFEANTLKENEDWINEYKRRRDGEVPEANGVPLGMTDGELIGYVNAIRWAVRDNLNIYDRYERHYNKKELYQRDIYKANIKFFIRLLKQVLKEYDVNNKPHLEEIHSTFVKKEDFKKFFGLRVDGGTIKGIGDMESRGNDQNYYTRSYGGSSIWLKTETSQGGYNYTSLLLLKKLSKIHSSDI